MVWKKWLWYDNTQCKRILAQKNFHYGQPESGHQGKDIVLLCFLCAAQELQKEHKLSVSLRLEVPQWGESPVGRAPMSPASTADVVAVSKAIKAP